MCEERGQDSDVWSMLAGSYSIGSNILGTLVLFPPERLQRKRMFPPIIHKFGIPAAQQPGANAEKSSPGLVPPSLYASQSQANGNDGSVFSKRKQ